VLVAGRGHDEARLRARAHRLGLDGACSFLGLVDHEQLAGLLASADVFVLPSLCAETRPASVAEASAAGLPVVATESPGTRESVVDGVTGLLVPRSDTTALAVALGRVLGDAGTRRRMAAGGRRLAVTQRSRTVMVDAVEAVLDETAWRARARRPG
jgi:glycosyltransferase involved in cell wall biosynthesis